MKGFKQHAINLIKTFLLVHIFLLILFFLFFSRFPAISPSTAFFLAVDVATLSGFSHSLISTSYNQTESWIFLLMINTAAIALLYFACRFYQLMAVSRKMMSKIFEFPIFSAQLVKEICVFLAVFQGVVFILVFYAVSGNVVFESLADKIYFSLSYAMGSVTHFRIDMLGSGNWKHLPGQLLVFKLAVTLGTLVGSLGYFAAKDLFYPPNLRYRMQYPETNWKRYTRIALAGVFITILVSGILIYVQEHQQTFSTYKLSENIFSGFIWAANAQFGGLDNAVLHEFSSYTLLILTALMAVGGAAGTTTGGVKFSLLYLAAQRHPLWKGIVGYLASIAFFNIILTYILSMSSGLDVSEAALLQASAFFNVGWGLELTQSEHHPNINLLALSMVIGRLTMILWPWLLVIKWKPTKLPEELIV